jgi:hypothetical protein
VGVPGSYGHARGLRANIPVAPPRVPLATRKFKALISFLERSSVKAIGLCRSQHDSKCRQSDYGKRELTHGRLPQFVEAPTLGCINFTLK